MFGLHLSLPTGALMQATLPQNTAAACKRVPGACDISVGLVMLTALSVCPIDHFYEPLN